jgi:hypothetical protein
MLWGATAPNRGERAQCDASRGPCCGSTLARARQPPGSSWKCASQRAASRRVRPVDGRLLSSARPHIAAPRPARGAADAGATRRCDMRRRCVGWRAERDNQPGHGRTRCVVHPSDCSPAGVREWYVHRPEQRHAAMRAGRPRACRGDCRPGIKALATRVLHASG